MGNSTSQANDGTNGVFGLAIQILYAAPRPDAFGHGPVSWHRRWHVQRLPLLFLPDFWQFHSGARRSRASITDVLAISRATIAASWTTKEMKFGQFVIV